MDHTDINMYKIFCIITIIYIIFQPCPAGLTRRQMHGHELAPAQCQ